MSSIPATTAKFKSPAALDDWTNAVAGPSISLPLRLWTWIVDRTPRLRCWRGHGEIANMPDVTDEDVARLLAMLVNTETRERVLALLAPGIRAIAREGRHE